MAPPVAAIAGDEDDGKDDLKLEKGTVEEAQVVSFEDQRPAVFKSTFWEICAVACLVCAQLTNVFLFAYGAEYRNWRTRNRLLFLL